jgi:hypothetical protein
MVLALSAFAFFGGYERLREGIRKPFLIHSHMFSNGLLIGDIDRLNRTGLASHSGWVAERVDEGQLATGRQIFRSQCSSCHTVDGYQAIRGAIPTVADMIALAEAESPAAAERVYANECAACHADFSAAEMQEMLPSADDMRSDPEMIRDLNRGMISATLVYLRDMGEAYTAAPRDRLIDPSGLYSRYMPPFVGTDDELEALADYLVSLDADGGVRLAEKGDLP